MAIIMGTFLVKLPAKHIPSAVILQLNVH